jgi:sulfite exporter TauE/SafE
LDPTLLAGLVGALLGMRHALEPDHLAAVSTLVAEQRSIKGGMMLGMVWGLGHSAALLAVGIALAVMRTSLPERLAEVFEFGVAIMLVVLGVRAIRRANQEGGAGPETLHRHGARSHVHAGASRHVHLGHRTLAIRPLLVGLVHGLAGSGSLTAFVVAGLPSHAARILYIALFGFGSVLGMATLTGVASASMRRLGGRTRLVRAVGLGSGIVSAGLGIVWGYPLIAAWIR